MRSLGLALVFFGFSVAATPVARTVSVTGGVGQPRDIDFGDPSPPDFSEPGFVRVYTTGGEVLSWRNMSDESALDQFLRGAPGIHKQIKVYHADGVTPFDTEGTGEDPWDVTIERIDGEEVLYAGVMTPTDGRSVALWPDDHWNRRTYAFKKVNKRWVMQPRSIFGEVPEHPTWIGHNYGHSLIEDANGDRYMFYERVTEERDGIPFKTEIFARRMKGAFTLQGPEIAVLRLKKSWPSARRGDGASLVEGPRPFRFGEKYFVSFSAGDYTSDSYAIHLLWADHIEGPYHPFLNESGDLRDFGRDVERTHKMTWGAGRAAFFSARKEIWAIFHGIEGAVSEDVRDGKRNLFLAPVTIELRGGDEPLVRIGP